MSAKFASMPTRTSVHTSAVNFTSVMGIGFHLFRCICGMKGLCRSDPGHMAHNRARPDGWETRRNEIERLGVFFRKGGESL